MPDTLESSGNGWKVLLLSGLKAHYWFNLMKNLKSQTFRLCTVISITCGALLCLFLIWSFCSSHEVGLP